MGVGVVFRRIAIASLCGFGRFVLHRCGSFPVDVALTTKPRTNRGAFFVHVACNNWWAILSLAFASLPTNGRWFFMPSSFPAFFPLSVLNDDVVKWRRFDPQPCAARSVFPVPVAPVLFRGAF